MNFILHSVISVYNHNKENRKLSIYICAIIILLILEKIKKLFVFFSKGEPDAKENVLEFV